MLRTALAALVATVLVAPAHASLTFVSTRAALGANDTIVWQQFGSAGTMVASDTPGTSTGGRGFTVRYRMAAPPEFEVLQQAGGDDVGSWFGAFQPDEFLLYALDEVVIVFDEPVLAVGTQVQANTYGAFGSLILAVGTFANFLGSFVVDGVSTNAADGSALFLGVAAESPIIKAILIGAAYENESGPPFVLFDFAINFVSFRAAERVEVPEPASLALLGLGLLGLAAARRRA